MNTNALTLRISIRETGRQGEYRICVELGESAAALGEFASEVLVAALVIAGA